MPFRFFARLLLLAALGAAPLLGTESESLPEHRLKDIVERQNQIMSEATIIGDRRDNDTLRTQMEQFGHEYESLLRDNPNFAPGYAAYGYMLWRIGMRKQAVGVLLKANALDPNIPLVKNELGNFMAEEGKPLEAVEYFLSAIKLDPKEPLYHYQLGTLLHEARQDFIGSGDWTRDSVDHTMHEAFRQAAELAPDRIEFTYRYAESFYDLDNPNWDEALKVWTQLEAKAPSEIERQTMRLHEANVLLRAGRPGPAREVLATITLPALDGQKKGLLDELAAAAKK